MYNKYLKTFLVVAETGSFNRAAEELYITASAVIQQINKLERDFSARLFVRSWQGLELTESGRYLQSEAEKYIEQGNKILLALRELDKKKSVIYVGTGPDEISRLLFEIWMLYKPQNVKCDVQLVFTDNITVSATQYEIVESVKDGAAWQDEWEFMELCKLPLKIAVGKAHPLKDKELITFDDMRSMGELVFIDRSRRTKSEEIIELLTQENIEFSVNHRMNWSTIWDATLNNRAMLVPSSWEEPTPQMRFIPCELSYNLPYGFFYKKKLSKQTQEFLDFTRELYYGANPACELPTIKF